MTIGNQSKGFGGKQVLPPLNNEQEARAIAIGLQEIRNVKKYVVTMYDHQTTEFNRVYAGSPHLFAKKFDKVYAEAHKKVMEMAINSEHFISGNFHKIEAIKNNLRLIQPLKEKRLSILYSILAFYDNKK